jgi:hypothetical protein
MFPGMPQPTLPVIKPQPGMPAGGTIKPMGGFGPSGPPTTGGFDYNLIKGTALPSPPSQGGMQATQQANAQTQGSMPGMPPPAVLKPGGVPLPLPPGGTGGMGGMGKPMGGPPPMGGMGGPPSMKKGGSVKAYAKGGMTSSKPKASSAPSRGDGIAQRGKTRGVMR